MICGHLVCSVTVFRAVLYSPVLCHGDRKATAGLSGLVGQSVNCRGRQTRDDFRNKHDTVA